MELTAIVITVSDSSFRGEREDRSGPAVVAVLREAAFTVVATAIVPDERPLIEHTLVEACGRAGLVVTTGGTGIGPRDVTPEATLAVAERTLPGIAERMRSEGARSTPFAVLSRGVCAVRGRALLLNLPGKPAAAADSLRSVLQVLPHALELLAGKTQH